jgi:hypothetical protein
MQTVLQALRQIIGTPDFYIDNGNYNSTWDYGAMIEYVVAALLVMICVSWIFRFLKHIFLK